MNKIVFTGGGTLGHVMPNLYLIEDLQQDYEIFYIGSNGIEKETIKSKNIQYYEIPTTKLRRGKFLKNLTIPFVLIKSIRQAKKILKEIKPNLIVSKGGYVSLPVCIAGKQLKIPIISHESDYSFGLANKIILKMSDKMCVNYHHLADNDKIIYTGPIISNQFKLSNIKSNVDLNLDSNKPTILFIGGSSGSKKINEIVEQSVEKLIKNFNIIHLTGKGNLNKLKLSNYNQMELCSNMPYLYSICDIVVGRSGAGVIFESAYMQKPMLLIPLQNANSRGDQVQNANYFKDKGGAKVLLESGLNSTTLIKAIEDCYKECSVLSNNLKKLNLDQGKEKMLKLINQLIKSKQ